MGGIQYIGGYPDDKTYRQDMREYGFDTAFSHEHRSPEYAARLVGADESVLGVATNEVPMRNPLRLLLKKFGLGEA